jgi:hypothetical protein
MYSSTLSLTSALDGVGGQRHAPAALTPGKTQFPLYRRSCWPHDRSGLVRKISPPIGIRSTDRQARNESLCQLSYPGPQNVLRIVVNKPPQLYVIFIHFQYKLLKILLSFLSQ